MKGSVGDVLGPFDDLPSGDEKGVFGGPRGVKSGQIWDMNGDENGH